MEKEKSTGERLKELRKKKNYTQVSVQLKTGIDQSDYSKIEGGKRYPTIEQAKKLSFLYDTSMDYIYGLTDDPRPYARNPKKKKLYIVE
jgi:transcriptional regulator with XRE-family HTH domain